jgi:tRNA (cmo5U34)-methyltransferase
MTDTAVGIFEAHADDYETSRRRLVPPFDALYATAVAALELAGRPMRRVLDLGAGTGLLARQVRAAHPEVALTLLDGAPAMLARARATLGDGPAYVVGDLAAALPAGPWDGVVSALAIHHLDDDAKRHLFARTHDALAPGGVFVNAEQVAGPTPLFAERYAAWHERRAAELGVTPQEWAEARHRMRLDRWASVEDQVTWMREAGFADADCLFKDHRFAVLVGRRADAGDGPPQRP